VLSRYAGTHPRCADEIKAWIRVAKENSWQKPGDVKACYPDASILQKGRVIFNINRGIRLIVHNHYKSGIVFIRFIGNHDAYDKIDPHTI
jgi:mRNA interferase HigB